MASERVEVITRTERRRRWSPAEKLRLVLATREPGATVASVAREHGVSESLLYAWRGRLPPSRMVGSAGATSADGFVPITVVDDRPVAMVGPGVGFVPLPSATIEIELPNGCRLRVHERVAASTLRKVGAVVGSVRPRC
jgi:transposase